MKKLLVTAFKDGSLFKASSNPANAGRGFIRVTQVEKSFVNGSEVIVKRSATARFDLTAIASMKLVAGQDLNEYLVAQGYGAHKIVVTETKEPQYEGHEKKINPVSNQPMVAADGGSIFYATNLALDVPENKDTIIPVLRVAASKPSINASVEEQLAQ